MCGVPTSAHSLDGSETGWGLHLATVRERYWNERWSRPVGYSYTEVTNTNFQDDSAFHKGEYASANLVCYPADNLTFGAEVLWGRRIDSDGASEDDVRLRFTAKFTFGTKLSP